MAIDYTPYILSKRSKRLVVSFGIHDVQHCIAACHVNINFILFYIKFYIKDDKPVLRHYFKNYVGLISMLLWEFKLYVKMGKFEQISLLGHMS